MSAENKVPTEAVAEVGVAHFRWWNALLANDTTELETLLADDLTFHSPYGTTSTKAEFVESLRSGRLRYNSIEHEAPLIRIHGQSGIVTGKADIHFQWEGQSTLEKLYYTAVYGFTAPNWHMLAWQSTQRAEGDS